MSYVTQFAHTALGEARAAAPQPAVRTCAVRASTTSNLCTTPQPCPAIPDLLCVTAVAGVPFEYVQDADGPRGARRVTRRTAPTQQRFRPPVLAALERFLAEMRAVGLPVEALLSLGSLNCRCVRGTNRRSEHSFGEAIDVVGVRWTGTPPRPGRLPETIVHNWDDPAERALLRRINACLRLVFPLVIDYHRADHRDHFHCDLNRGRGRSHGPSTWLFVQEALESVLGRPFSPTGNPDPATLQGLAEATGASGVPPQGTHDQLLDRLFRMVAAAPAAQRQPSPPPRAAGPASPATNGRPANGTRPPSPSGAPTPPAPGLDVPDADLKPVPPPKQPGSLERGYRTIGRARFRPDRSEPLDTILAATAAAEGGYDTVNLYDRGILSWGIMQWTVHAGSLQAMLAFVKRRLAELGQAALWTALFPRLDVVLIGGKPQLTHDGAPVAGEAALRMLFRGAVARGEYDPETIRHWARVFARAGRHPLIQQLQREYARYEVRKTLDQTLGTVLARYRTSSCRRPANDLWRSICAELTASPEEYRARYGRVRDYVGPDIRAAALFFGMWTNNPAMTYVHLRRAVDRVAGAAGGHDGARWSPEVRAAFAREFENVLRASRFAWWGDAKAAAAGRKSRTAKIVEAVSRVQAG